MSSSNNDKKNDNKKEANKKEARNIAAKNFLDHPFNLPKAVKGVYNDLKELESKEN